MKKVLHRKVYGGARGCDKNNVNVTPDIEKVIKGLECLVSDGKCDLMNYPYGNVNQCINSVLSDAIALLKEQEAVSPKKGKTPEESAFDCGNCGYPLWEDELYCAHCGKAVKWE